MVFVDNFGRPLLNLRMAVTRRCNLRCQFCHREGEENHTGTSADKMTVDEIVRIAKVAANVGISRIKLTGGEPLMRKDIVEIVKGIASIRGVTDLSMTTNGTLLAFLATELHTGGLERVNVSVPTLDGEVYGKLTGGRLEDALAGVEAAVKAGFSPVKLNMLVLNGINDDVVPEMVEFASENRAILQLIELEPVNVDDSYYQVNHRSLDEYETMLKEKAVSVETRRYMQSRKVYHLPDVTVEVVHPIENTEFCRNCTRLRVTSDGELKPCLMRSDNLVDILTAVKKGASDEQITELFALANERRCPYNS